MKWGLRVELFFILIFIVCLLISTIGFNKLGILGEPGSFEGNANRYSYRELEQIVSSGALKYYEERYRNVADTMTIKTSTLASNGYISSLYDEKGRKCDGYAKIINGKTSIAYIKCPAYKTSGYDSSNE